jgi:hypothetical protein
MESQITAKMGYIPVPGQPYPQPTAEQMMAAEILIPICYSILNNNRVNYLIIYHNI